MHECLACGIIKIPVVENVWGETSSLCVGVEKVDVCFAVDKRQRQLAVAVTGHELLCGRGDNKSDKKQERRGREEKGWSEHEQQSQRRENKGTRRGKR